MFFFFLIYGRIVFRAFATWLLNDAISKDSTSVLLSRTQSSLCIYIDIVSTVKDFHYSTVDRISKPVYDNVFFIGHIFY